MKKLTYIKLFNREANKKIWNFLFSKYQIVEQKSKLLAYCCLPIICIVFGFMAILGWASSLVLLSMDTQFTPHYLRTTILHKKMTNEQVNQYLRSQEYKYKKSVSFGNMSNKKRKSIETTFDLLYNEYKLPVSSENHEKIISNISNLQISVDKTNNGVQNVVSAITNISTSVDKVVTYTKQKEQDKKVELERVQSLREAQEKRNTTAKDREKGRKLTSFQSTLSNQQIKILVDYCNKIPVFNRDIEFQEIKDILLCVHTKPLKVNINKYIALLFTELQTKKLICKTWKSVAFRHECLISSKDKILNQNDLYMANDASGLIDPKAYDLIEECIKEIINCNK